MGNLKTGQSKLPGAGAPDRLNGTDGNHVAQTAPSAVCGFSSPNWPNAADLPEKQAVCATRHTSPFHQSLEHRWGARCEVRKKMPTESPLGRARAARPWGECVVSNRRPTPALRDRCRFASPLPRGDFLRIRSHEIKELAKPIRHGSRRGCTWQKSRAGSAALHRCGVGR